MYSFSLDNREINRNTQQLVDILGTHIIPEKLTFSAKICRIFPLQSAIQLMPLEVCSKFNILKELSSLHLKNKNGLGFFNKTIKIHTHLSAHRDSSTRVTGVVS